MLKKYLTLAHIPLYIVNMGKLLKKVFGKNGIVSNAVDLATVPNLINEKKREVDNIASELNELESRYAYIGEEVRVLTEFEQDIAIKASAVDACEAELQVLFASPQRDTKAIALKSGHFHTMTEELEALQEKYQLKVEHHTKASVHYDEEKKNVEERLAAARNELVELEEKLKRKKGQMDGNLKGFGK